MNENLSGVFVLTQERFQVSPSRKPCCFFQDFGNEVYGINYNKWRICKDAIKKGEELNLPVYKFLEGPLVEKFGKEWYDELCEVAEQVLAELED